MSNTHFVGSPGDPSLVTSSSQTRLDDLESATSPGADSDSNQSSFSNTPADTTGATAGDLDEDSLVRAHRFRPRLDPLGSLHADSPDLRSF